jgi:hypothetical protein
MKYRTKREMSNPRAVKLKNGRPATRGTCSKCGTKMFMPHPEVDPKIYVEDEKRRSKYADN